MLGVNIRYFSKVLMKEIIDQPTQCLNGTVVLLSDSTPLFRNTGTQHVMDFILASIRNVRPRSAYLGASNGDDLKFYGIFKAAMDYAPKIECRHIKADFNEGDISYLRSCDIVVLAGGSVELGWRSIGTNEIKSALVKLYDSGKVLVGVSAGAIQLGLFGYSDSRHKSLFPALAIAPYIVSVHEEPAGFPNLKKMIKDCNYICGGLGIARRSGVILQQDMFYSFGDVIEFDGNVKPRSGLIDSDSDFTLLH